VAVDDPLGDEPDAATVPAITVLGMHMDAMATLLVNSGDLTPQGARIIRRAVREHLPGVTFEGDP
jgi:hypothetical protein